MSWFGQVQRTAREYSVWVRRMLLRLELNWQADQRGGLMDVAKEDMKSAGVGRSGCSRWLRRRQVPSKKQRKRGISVYTCMPIHVL